MISSGCTSEYYVQNSNANFCTSPYANQCISSYLSQNTNLYMNPCMSQWFMNNTNNLYVNPCINQSMCGCMNQCMNQCMKCCKYYNCCNCGNSNVNDPPQPGVGVIDGAKGPFLWHIEYYIDEKDIHKSFFKVRVTIFGVKIIDTVLDVNHPEIDINFSISGIGIKGELGVDLTKRYVYLKGTLNFVYYKKDFNIILYQF